MSRLLRCLSLLLAASVAGCGSLYGPSFELPIEEFPTLADGEGESVLLEDVDPEKYAEGEKFSGQYAVKQLKQLAKNRPPLRRPESEEDPVNMSGFPGTNSAIATRILLAKTPRGSYVRCSNSSERSYSGLIGKISKDEVVLANCVYTTMGLTSDEEPQAVVNYAPTVSVDASTLTRLTIFSVPKDDAEATRLLRHDPNDVVREVVFKSGRRQRLDAEPDGGSAAATVGSLAELAAGSVVRFSDLKGRRVEGTVLRTES